MADAELTYQKLLDGLPVGVMSLGAQGEISRINPAAAKLLGVVREEVRGKSFEQVFADGLAKHDELLETIRKAYLKKSSIKDLRIPFTRPGGEPLIVSLFTMPLDDDNFSLTFSDVTQEEAARQQQERQSTEATGLALRLRQEKERLEAELKGGSLLRLGAALLIILLFLVAGYFAWTRTPLVAYVERQLSGAKQTAQKAQNVYTVAPRPLSSSISLSGTVAPYETINVLSPFAGRVLERHFDYGQKVEKGKFLLRLDTSELDQKFRDAEVALIKARENYQRLKDWKNSDTVLHAKRDMEKAKNDAAITQQKLSESEVLYQKGIIPLDEYRSLKGQVENQKINMRTLKDQLRAAMEKGNARNLLVARLQLENAQAKLDKLKGQIKDSQVTAPVMGVIIKPTTGLDSKQAKEVQVGSEVAEGQLLFALGNLERLSVLTKVGELNVTKLVPGQKVKLTSFAFPGLMMEGRIAAVSSQVSPGSDSAPPSFSVKVATAKLNHHQRGKLRLGMSAELQVEVSSHPKALVVPITAVHPHPGGGFAVTLAGVHGGKETPVTTGLTTVDSVEITSGLKAGDKVLLPAGPTAP
ncbi:MAG: efflux RND transporter periplasmic adaptor subunit [Proteobacteria bacterium]|nr:efflux RND transporter periplasmic adaptor subunit [Pseudomonadota bacterium]MBU1449408.1 efflux RND transporter periplasmic adaptor subunit [Pseudomonadota bacterium]MBU2470550.1 efflux RND transporter periplasmic adaptor subunit [Pseudomonadota bacterium]MBU2516241.1 efflux RND transporter periplasmic adaptor subunit [Pseudomonadota bacterium]